jgi:hypothetical protein
VSRPSDDSPSARVIEQRVRNRVIEYLELAASFEEQVKYEERASIAYVPAEVINQWEDWVWDVHKPLSVYSEAEARAMVMYEAALDRANRATGDGWPSVREVQRLPEWQAMREAAEQALAVFMQRGFLPEDREVKD